jgi:hypothetical protein
MQVKITSGTTEVISSGTVISFEGNPISIELEKLKFTFEFIDEEGKGESVVKFTASNNAELKISLLNFKNPIGSGVAKPSAVALINNRRLFLNFRIYHINTNDKILHYTFYLGGEEIKK